MSEVEFREAPLGKLERLFVKRRSTNARLVIASQDDKILARTATNKGLPTLKLPDVECTGLDRLSADVKGDDYIWNRLLGVSGQQLGALVDVEYLGVYRLVPPNFYQMTIGVAVEVDVPSTEIPTDPSLPQAWHSFEQAATLVRTPGPIDADPDVQDSRAILDYYLRQLTT